MKHKNRKPTARERGSGSAPMMRRCDNPGCAFECRSKLALKEHKRVCRHG